MGWYGRKWLHGGWCGWMDVAAWWVLFGHVYAMEVIGWRWLAEKAEKISVVMVGAIGVKQLGGVVRLAYLLLNQYLMNSLTQPSF